MDKYQFAYAGSAKKNRWHQDSLTPDVLSEMLMKHPERIRKDGPAFVPGLLVGGERKKDTIEQLDMFVFDVDGQQSYDEAADLVDDSGYYAIISTTYSHLQTVTNITVRAFTSFARRNRWDLQHGITLDQVKQYLQENKKAYLENVSIKSDGVKVDGTEVIQVKHAPVEKLRIFIPMKEPFIFKDHSYDRMVAAEKWTNLYMAVGRHLKLNFDESCSDASRLYYLPAHPPEGIFRNEEIGKHDQDDLIDWQDFADAAEVQKTTRALESQAKRHERASELPSVTTDRAGREFSLLNWYQKNRKTFSIVDCFNQYAPTDIKEPTSKGGYHITCPNEAEHSTPGGTGTFCDDPDEGGNNNGSFVIMCHHAHCEGMMPLDFLHLLVRDGTFTLDELDSCSEGDDFGGEPEQDEEDPKEDLHAQAASNVQSSRISKPSSGIETDVAQLAEEAKTASFISEVINAIDRMSTTITLRDEIHIVAHTPFTTQQLREYHAARKGDISKATKSEFLTEVYKARERLSPIKKMLSTLIDTKPNAVEASEEQKRLRELYNISEKDMTKLYKAMYTSVNGDFVPKDLKKALKGYDRYGKIKVKDDVLFIDLITSRLTGKAETIKKSGLITQNQSHFVKVSDGDGGQDRIEVAKYWMDNAQGIPFYDGVEFDPSMTTSKYNLFNGFTDLVPAQGDWEMVRDHIHTSWCGGSDELFGWVMTYMAHIFQDPAKRPPTAIALVGGQGIGKSLPIEHGLATMLGPYYHITSKKEDIVGQFTPALNGSLLTLCEEALFKGDRATMDMMKAIISGDKVRTEEKFMNAENKPIFTRFFFTSNHEHFLGLEPDDRRFCVLAVGSEHKNDVDYFLEMHNRMRGLDGLPNMSRAWMHDLMHWDPETVGLSWADLHTPPRTEMKTLQIKYSRTPEEQFYYDLLINGEITDVDERHLEDGNLYWPYDQDDFLMETRLLKTAFRDFMGFVSPSHRAFNLNGYTQAYKTVFGSSIGELSRPIRVNKKVVRFTALGSRKALLQQMYEKGRVTKNELEVAAELADLVEEDEKDDGQ